MESLTNMELENTINSPSVLMLVYLKRSYVGVSSIFKYFIQNKCLFYLIYLNKCNILPICMVCLIYLLLLSIHTADLLSNITRCDCSGTTSGSLSRNSLFSILKCPISISEVHDTVYSLSVLD